MISGSYAALSSRISIHSSFSPVSASNPGPGARFAEARESADSSEDAEDADARFASSSGGSGPRRRATRGVARAATNREGKGEAVVEVEGDDDRRQPSRPRPPPPTIRGVGAEPRAGVDARAEGETTRAAPGEARDARARAPEWDGAASARGGAS